MAAVASHLTKSKFLAGLNCRKRLWLSRHRPDRATPPTPGELAIREAGSEIGRLARRLFPGGVLVEIGPSGHAAAVERTRGLLADSRVPAVFEAAFEFADVRVRVDVLERLGPAAWGLREVKASARVKPPHIDDLAIQQFVLAGCGLDVRSVELIHVNPGFELVDESIAWEDFFARAELSDATALRLESLPGRVAELRQVVSGSEPEVEPGRHCRTRHVCEFWAHCTRSKPSDWIFRLPRITRKQAEAFADAAIESIADIPSDLALQRPQRNVRELVCSGASFVGHGLDEALRGSGPPASYLDFEVVSPAVPIYPGTRPFDGIPFQWSLHRVDADGRLSHADFLAAGSRDPSREFAESLLAVLGSGREPIVVYSAFENRVLENLANRFGDLRDALLRLRARLFDLLPVVRNCTYHADFGGSFSIKRVAPALAPGFGYAGLDGIAEGGAAASAFERIASGSLRPDRAAGLREELLAYCRNDTLALVHVHRALRERAAS
jgi:hypothetical protein